VDNFSVRWSGQFLAPATATYTFHTTSDDGVRLYVNGQTVIDNWTDHAPTANSGSVTLNAGQLYPIVLEFYEFGGGAVISLEYEAAGAGIARQILPADRVFPRGNGWSAQYYKDAGDGSHLVGSPLATRTDATINFSDSTGWAETLVPGTGVDNFSVRWSGQFLAPATANYTFYTTSDDGVRLYINGQTFIDNWTDHAPTVNSVTVTLNAGQFYPIVLEFYEFGGGAVISLEYESTAAGIPRQILPADRVY